MDLRVPANTPPGEEWRYSAGMPLQIGPKTAGIICSIARRGTRCVDFAAGCDLIVLDNPHSIGPEPSFTLLRPHEETNTKTQTPCTMSKYGIHGGFVPLGAKRADGSNRPHAGTGFGMGTVIGFPTDLSQKRPYREPDRLQYMQLHQLAYDGTAFRVTGSEKVPSPLENGWEVLQPGLTPGIRVGDDFLVGACCRRVAAAQAVSGVVRFRCEETKWQPGSFVPVTDQGSGWTEPSLTREADGALLFSARGRTPDVQYDVAVWRSPDEGTTWEQLFYLEEARDRTPVTINTAADGSPYVAGNRLGHYREILCIWPLNEERTGLEEGFVVRHPREEFGPPPERAWVVDHPIAATLRLSDGEWHHMLTYRLIELAENRSGMTPTPHSGCYVEEVFSQAMPVPAWDF